MYDRKRKQPSLTGPPDAQLKITPDQIERMLLSICRFSNLFVIAKNQLTPELFSRTERIYGMLWQAALTVEKELQGDFFLKPEKAMLYVYNHLEPRFSNDTEMPVTLKNMLLDMQTGLVSRIFEADISKLESSLAHGLLKRFLRERAVQQPLFNKLMAAQGSLLNDLPDILQEAQKLDIAFNASDSDPVESCAPEGWEPAKLGKFPTNVEFIDRFLRGGHAPCEVYGVLGAFASGKTSLAVQIVAQCALGQQQYADDLNKEAVNKDEVHYPKECYIFPYEATGDEVRMRMWSSVCTIKHEALEDFQWDKLSTSDKLKDYELEYYDNRKKAGMKDKILGERERLEHMLPLLRRNIWVIDMTGTADNNTKRGTGYVKEIRQIIEADLHRKEQKSGRKHEVGVIVIDYAGLAARRYMTEHDISDDELRHYISRFGYECKRELAVPLNCPVWVFHQLTGEANKRTSAVQQHYTDAAESKSFAENLAFCFALGTKDEEHNTLLFSCSKARRAKIGNPPTLVMEGEFFRLAESKNFFYDLKTRGFMKKSNMADLDVEKATPNSSKIESPTSKPSAFKL